MSKFIVANLASALMLIAAGSVLAAPDSSTSSQPADQTSASAQATSTPASGSQTPAAKPAAKAAKQKTPSDIICKPDSGTGSRVGGVKICLTREQWKQRDD